mmetsp:Transcript_5816/g.8917  ORF Transcript_5816/g.8917 Transcript_5816/m.8917 type:complete len:80 (-) Transcript_5816:254-493(-)
MQNMQTTCVFCPTECVMLLLLHMHVHTDTREEKTELYKIVSREAMNGLACHPITIICVPRCRVVCVSYNNSNYSCFMTP